MMRKRLTHSSFLFSLLSLASCLRVLDPPHGSAVDYAEDEGLVLLYRSLSQGMMKVDVLGYGDPHGWPGTVISGLRRVEGGVEGIVRMLSLKPGAVRIRIRLLTEDGRDAIEEVEVEYLVQPSLFFQQIFSSNVWMQRRAAEEVGSCCGELVGGCMYPDASWMFCESAMEMMGEGREEEPRQQKRCRQPGKSAVFAMIHGYDVERLFLFVQSLRDTGFAGDLHLVDANPEVSCDNDSESCRRVLRYLKHENVTRHPFPDEIDWGRQHLNYHDGIIVALLMGHFAHHHGRAYGRLLFINGVYSMFQSDPFLEVDHGCRLLVSQRGIDDGRWSSCMEVKAPSSRQLLRGDFAMGSAEALEEHAAAVVLLYWKLLTARGTRCSLSLDLFASSAVSWRVERGEELRSVREGGELVVSLIDSEFLCHVGMQERRACKKTRGRESSMSRQLCLNSGCCYSQAEPGSSSSSSSLSCFEPARRGDLSEVYRVINGSIFFAAQDGEERRRRPAIVFNTKGEEEFISSFWKRHATLLQRFFPPKPAEQNVLQLNRASSRFPPHPQERANRMINSGAWKNKTGKDSTWECDEKMVKSSAELVSLLQHVDIHLFGDSRMRALAFSLMRLLFPSVDDTDDNLKELVVPLEHADLCGGNKRYENHVACASKMGFAIKTDNLTVSFHELFHFDHGPTLAAMIDTFLLQSRRQHRSLVVVMAPGFHFISQAPFDAASMMASFLPQIVDAVWDFDWRYELPIWLSMEPTSGGKGSWPELEAVNEVARRTWNSTGAAVLLDLYSLALPRPDLLTDGSHYSFRYRREAAALLLSILCEGRKDAQASWGGEGEEEEGEK